ncbi:MAG: transposase, partial [Cellvibrionales bacterium TMED122]
MESLSSGVQYRHWSVDDAKACVLLAHGLAEHTGRYEHVAERFNERGVAVVGPDHIGHGASPGARVYLKAFSEYLGPMRALLARIDEWYPERPVFLFGHSMGGL